MIGSLELGALLEWWPVDDPGYHDWLQRFAAINIFLNMCFILVRYFVISNDAVATVTIVWVMFGVAGYFEWMLRLAHGYCCARLLCFWLSGQ